MDFNPLPSEERQTEFHTVAAVSCFISRSCLLQNSFILDDIEALIIYFFFPERVNTISNQKEVN